LGEAHPNTARCLHSLASIYKSQGQYAKALPLFKQALAIRQEKLGSEHPKTEETQASYDETLQKIKEQQ
jgi:hypothetical protein